MHATSSEDLYHKRFGRKDWFSPFLHGLRIKPAETVLGENQQNALRMLVFISNALRDKPLKEYTSIAILALTKSKCIALWHQLRDSNFYNFSCSIISIFVNCEDVYLMEIHDNTKTGFRYILIFYFHTCSCCYNLFR